MADTYTIEEAEKLACERAGLVFAKYKDGDYFGSTNSAIHAHAKDIQKYEQKPVDPMRVKLREALYGARIIGLCSPQQAELLIDRLIPELRSRGIDYVGEGK